MKSITTNKSSAKKHRTKVIVIVAAVLVGAGLVYGVAAYQNSYWPFATSDITDAPLASDRYDNYPDEDRVDEDAAESTSNGSTAPSKPGMSVREADPSDDSNHDSKVSVKATQEGDSVVVRSQLQSFDRGVCRLEITNGTKSYSDTADIIYQPQGSICAGFSIPVTQLGTGTWNINLNAEGAHANGSASATIKIT